MFTTLHCSDCVDLLVCALVNIMYNALYHALQLMLVLRNCTITKNFPIVNTMFFRLLKGENAEGKFVLSSNVAIKLAQDKEEIET